MSRPGFDRLSLGDDLFSHRAADVANGRVNGPGTREDDAGMTSGTPGTSQIARKSRSPRRSAASNPRPKIPLGTPRKVEGGRPTSPATRRSVVSFPANRYFRPSRVNQWDRRAPPAGIGAHPRCSSCSSSAARATSPPASALSAQSRGGRRGVGLRHSLPQSPTAGRHVPLAETPIARRWERAPPRFRWPPSGSRSSCRARAGRSWLAVTVVGSSASNTVP